MFYHVSNTFLFHKSNYIHGLKSFETTLEIGSGNTFECRSYVESSGVGHNNVIQSLARVLGSSLIESDCIVGLNTVVHDSKQLNSGTIVYGPDNLIKKRFDDNSEYKSTLSLHQAYLKEVLINYSNTLAVD
ncbi:hypothetical protein BB560_003102 [Smittium megazygosporum]|uniref:Dynactin subunit 6 n=1 Tax=Smittium megazygosporum TaxID=133381 RepID=A0A2T9ZCY1_9FUNG|nr:hypothetical protein BB560_003102 [Smittium megazygosporum]